MSAQPLLWDGDTIPGLVITHPVPRRRRGGANVADDLEQARRAAARAALATIGKPRGPKPRPAQTALLEVVPEEAPVHPLIENLEWMLEAGETLAGIAFRLGMREEAITRGLQPDRLNRPDLLARLQTAAADAALPTPRRELGEIGGTDTRPDVDEATINRAQMVLAGRAVAAADPAAALVDVLAALGITGRVGGS